MTQRPGTRVNAGGKPAADRARRARDHSVTTMTAYPLLARRRAVAGNRAAAVAPHLDRTAVVEILDDQPRIEGQGSVRGGHLPHVVHLAAGRPPTVERVPVPGRQSGLLVADPSRYWGKNGGARAGASREQDDGDGDPGHSRARH